MRSNEELETCGTDDLEGEDVQVAQDTIRRDSS